MVDKFAQNVHIKPGALHGWHESQSTETRHTHLREAAARDGWAVVSKRLNFIANVANRSNNRKLHRIARADQRWAARHEDSYSDSVARGLRREHSDSSGIYNRVRRGELRL